MNPQADMALGLTQRPWIAYLRGLPWPAHGEANPVKALSWKILERAALTRALEVWATTPALKSDVGSAVDRIVPPGIESPLIELAPLVERTKFVWAARYSPDKNPGLFISAMRGLDVRGVMFGSGPMETEIRRDAPPNVEVPGWVERSSIWMTARAYVGTSTREAFGRSAVEAAMLGIPVVISDEFGCAPFLYTDPELARLFVLPITERARWTHAIELLSSDLELCDAVSAHLQHNASRLSIAAAVDAVRNAAERVANTEHA